MARLIALKGWIAEYVWSDRYCVVISLHCYIIPCQNHDITVFAHSTTDLYCVVVTGTEKEPSYGDLPILWYSRKSAGNFFSLSRFLISFKRRVLFLHTTSGGYEPGRSCPQPPNQQELYVVVRKPVVHPVPPEVRAENQYVEGNRCRVERKREQLFRHWKMWSLFLFYRM